ncbi:MAG: LamG domain-containing protein, partial [Candidatus Hodarchaeales archaeon]
MKEQVSYRSKKKSYLTIFLLLEMIVFSIHFYSEPIIPVMAEEFENVDSFQVHPANRWETPISTSTESISVGDSLLNYSDTGVKEQSSARDRQLSKNDFKVSGRVKTPELTNAIEPFPTINSNQMVGYWKMDTGSGNTVVDSTVNGNDGDMTGHAADWVTNDIDPEFDTALDFEAGSSEYIEISDADELTFTDGTNQSDIGFSISLWFKYESVVGTDTLVSKYDSSTNNSEWVIYFTTTVIQLGCYSPTGADRIARNYNYGAELVSNTYHLLVCTYDGSKSANGIDIYINTTVVDDTDSDIGSYVGMNNTASDVLFGADNAGSRLYYDGIMDEVILWNRSLSATDVSLLYNSYFESPPLPMVNSSMVTYHKMDTGSGTSS